MAKNLYKGQQIAVHVLDEHILPNMPQPIPLGGWKDVWDLYFKKCLEILGPGYSEADICDDAGYFITTVEEVIGDQVLFKDSYGELRLVPGDEVITREEAPKAFETWLEHVNQELKGEEQIE